jgi:hypothetical protein
VIALVAIAVAGALVMVGIGVAVFVFLRSDEGKKAVSVVGEGAKIARDAQNAPGAAELRQLGCQSALIMDLGEVAKRFDPSTKARTKMLYITCQVRFGVKDGPTCEQAAGEYLRAVGGTAKSRFVVVVQKAFQSKPACSELYEPDGASLGPFGSGDASPDP